MSKDKDLIEKEFIVAIERARYMVAKKNVDSVEKEELSGIYQQATQGNCKDWKVSRTMGNQLLDLRSKDKYTSWTANKGLNDLEAKQMYITRVEELATKYSVVFPEHRRSGFGSNSLSSSNDFSHVN